MTAANITLTPLTEDDREQFILDNQYAFKFGAVEEFGMRDDHLDGDGESISRGTIEHGIDHGIAYFRKPLPKLRCPLNCFLFPFSNPLSVIEFVRNEKSRYTETPISEAFYLA